MKLTYVERWLLANQYRMLEILDPEDWQYAAVREALENGYEVAYDWGLAPCVDEEVLPTSDCQEVMAILSMFKAIYGIFAVEGNRHLQNGGVLDYNGFDGETEQRQLAFVRFMRRRYGRWKEVPEGTEHDDSHKTMLPQYRAMLSVWKKMPEKHRLTELDLQRIAAVLFAEE